MRLTFNKATALLALVALAALPAPGALAASSGGAAAPTSAPAASSSSAAHKAKAHTADIATWFGPGFYGQKTACGRR